MTSGCTIIVGVSYRIYFVGVLNIGEKLNKSPIAKIKSSPINLPVRYMEKSVLREYDVIDFYALYLVIRMPASWHVFADPVTYTLVEKMGKSCCVVECANRYSKSAEILFYGFQ